MLKILVGSKNPVKINAAKTIFQQYFPEQEIHCEGCHAPSGVPDQPLGELDTRLGAQNRVDYLKAHFDADFYCAMEGGAAKFDYGAATFAFVVIANKQHSSVSRSCNLPLPEKIYSALEQGEELGHVMDRVFNTTNIKQKGGAIGLLTNNLATRESSYTQALTLAMAPFIHSELYS
ncbi:MULTISPECIES: inosine/xanthosine triphosphatase [Pseudoalteromonas]|uniref:Inosine/xanthosine triphosphatase n=1 Tax=Pseudoalteromonas obscura TaxID=3048491 RepID=A0ABT7EQW8_9GAMM|nr:MULTISPECIES: inosine/xanthosine triphosphatase [Pseudoalteromonas]MBQ4838139.1 inosine/xanthosine triphosphatase [Pseudoalteromonas luteoviolacea]MDK2597449.1 inosine/xanthosine triphosphatase [Pseudoalteromonas sp. P94(2023)]